MSEEVVLLVTALSALGGYINFAFLKATKRTALIPKPAKKLLRFVSSLQIVLCCCNVVSVVGRWRLGNPPLTTCYVVVLEGCQAAVFWILVDRLVFCTSRNAREKSSGTYYFFIRMVVVVHCIIAAWALMYFHHTLTESDQHYFGNFWFDIYHGGLLLAGFVILIVMGRIISQAEQRAKLLGGLKNDARIQSFRSQGLFLKRSCLPLFFCWATILGHQTLFRLLPDFDEPTRITLDGVVASIPPLYFPLSIVIFDRNLKGDFFSNLLICRKTRNAHKQSKVQVITTRESQESIIANLKMIGILSEFEGAAPETTTTSSIPPPSRGSRGSVSATLRPKPNRVPVIVKPVSIDNRLAVPKLGVNPPVVSADEAVSFIQSNTDVYIHNHAATPTELLQALCRRVDDADLSDIRTTHIILAGELPFTAAKYHGRIRANPLFICAGTRKSNFQFLGHADYTTMFLSDVPKAYLSGKINVDVALITVSPPDERGFCSMGVDVDCSLAAATSAKHIIALVNPSMPRTLGHSIVHQSNFKCLVKTERPIYARSSVEEPNDVEKRIGKIIAENLVDNGATLQLGIGAIPDSALLAMNGHKNLGVHTEMFSDGVIELMDKGVINNSQKSFMPGKVVSCFAFGTRKFYETVNENPEFYFAPCDFTNNIDVIRANSKMTSINSCLEIDLTGQIASDAIGPTFFSGFGGQVDFMTATPLAHDGLGKAVIAMPSRTTKGKTKIVPFLSQGSGVVTTRGHARYVATEHGIAELWGKSMRQRAFELIQIAHADDREQLEKDAFQRLKCMPSP
ncbi:unnamed protein product [Caenorhabditis auriculariae]|uniref:Acetyl-CoA hydrolase n=1 Tax=Caenorhabditis auriculariae TaxID=2777116 RepID=A0A8S1HJD9_9PELO|nr:unnamed protein product [Caenorhabditis auriculariae]